MTRYDTPNPTKTLGVDRVMLRLAVLGALIVAIFVALFSRLWFLQVLASPDYRRLAKENRVRLVQSEPPRGRILDRNGIVLVENRYSLTVTVDRQVVPTRPKARRVLARLSKVLHRPVRDLEQRFGDEQVSPYKPVAVANDVSEKDAYFIHEHQERFPGVAVERLPVRKYPKGRLAAHVLGYVGEIREEQLESDHLQGVRPRYAPGDLVGQSGVEYIYDRYLRGSPHIRKVVVNSVGDVVDSTRRQRERAGKDLYLALDARIQRLTEKALRSGIEAARGAGYQAPAGAVAVLDPDSGEALALASSPTYGPTMLADGITSKEWSSLGQRTETTDDDQLVNRSIQSGVPPGSVFKVVTAGAAMANGLASPYSTRPCPPVFEYRETSFPNWSSADYGYIGFPRSLEISCDTFYYALGAEMEERFGPIFGDGTERFQRYMRQAGFGRPTGIDLPEEFAGRVPDEQWCRAVYEETKDDPFPLCASGWLPGYTVNMAIGQGDLLVSPIQMAVTYAAIANGGKVVEPRLALSLAKTRAGEEQTVRKFKSHVARKLPLDDTELAPIRDGLTDVVAGEDGTARSAFEGYPMSRHPIAGKTGTAQIGNTDLNYAWFVSYGPVGLPDYVISVYLEKAGHGGESAAPIAREIWEGIYKIDKETDVRLGQDVSG